MSQKLPSPGPQYSQENESQARALLERRDAQTMKVGEAFTNLMMVDTVTGARVTLTVASGVLVIT